MMPVALAPPSDKTRSQSYDSKLQWPE
jgi:hypothetical protein